MDVTQLAQVIGSLGFPIVAYILLFNYMKQEMAELQKVVAENTMVIKRLLDHIQRQEGDDDM